MCIDPIDIEGLILLMSSVPFTLSLPLLQKGSLRLQGRDLVETSSLGMYVLKVFHSLHNIAL